MIFFTLAINTFILIFGMEDDIYGDDIEYIDEPAES